MANSRLAADTGGFIVNDMRSLRALMIYILVVFVGGALLAPWLYWLVHLFAHEFPKIAAEPFHRYVDRSFLILALAGLWPLLRALGVNSWREAGVVGPEGQWAKLLVGLLVGFLSLALVAGSAFACGNRVSVHNADAHAVVAAIFNGLGTAVVVAIIEELLFRGGIFGGLRKFFYWPLALVISSFVYAFIHFLREADFTGEVGWQSGLELLPRILSGFTEVQLLMPAFLNLTVSGLLLGLAYQRTGNLYFSMGMHAGWIFWSKTYGTLTTAAPGAPTWFWGTSKMLDGWFTLVVLVVVLVLFDRLSPRPRNEPFSPPR